MKQKEKRKGKQSNKKECKEKPKPCNAVSWQSKAFEEQKKSNRTTAKQSKGKKREKNKKARQR